MPRRLKLKTHELGFQELYLIYDVAGTWETEWAPFQGHPIAALFARASKEEMDHALHGWTRPLVQKLGPMPALLLKKLPESTCAHQAKCPLFQGPVCAPTHPKMPWCFQPRGTDEQTGMLASEVIRLWREGVYIVVVAEGVRTPRRNDGGKR